MILRTLTFRISHWNLRVSGESLNLASSRWLRRRRCLKSPAGDHFAYSSNPVSYLSPRHSEKTFSALRECRGAMQQFLGTFVCTESTGTLMWKSRLWIHTLFNRALNSRVEIRNQTQVWLHTPVIAALRRWRKEDREFKAALEFQGNCQSPLQTIHCRRERYGNHISMNSFPSFRNRIMHGVTESLELRLVSPTR